MNRKISLWLKWVFIIFMGVFLTSYWIGYGPLNFLWLSDIFLMIAFLATLFESKFLASMAATGGLLFLILWGIDFLFTLYMFLSGHSSLGFTRYIFNHQLPLGLRLLSLFHIALIPILFWLLFRLGYDKRAWPFQVALTWIVIWVTWFIVPESNNINLVFFYKQLHFPAIPYLVLGCIAMTLLIFFTHWLLLHFHFSKIRK